MSELEKYLGYRLRRDEPLARYTAARLGGNADWLYMANARNVRDEMIEVVSVAWSEGMPVHILGGGANVLIADTGLRGLVVINRISEVEFGEWHSGANVSATSGTNLSTLARLCQQRGLSGLEWTVGVPGTVGGAVINNAGAHGSDMAANVTNVVILDAARGPQLLTLDDLQYRYRESALKTRESRQFLVLLATLQLKKDDPEAILAKMEKYTAYRKSTQPAGASLGSIFKNPPGDYAGRLIETANLKGYQIGNVQVSPVHANFFINTGDARASDYFALINHVHRVVQEIHGVSLELEIETLGDYGSA